VLRGEPGVGKTALLGYVIELASGLRVARAAGVQSEMELAFAGLYQLLEPMLDRLERLPAPQRDALRAALGIRPGPAPDRFLVGLAVLGLLSDENEERPLICLVDDEQWLDRASAQALAFVARRLQADSVGLIFATRGPSEELAGLPQLAVKGLREDDARALLELRLTARLDSQVRDQIVNETRGNPLALLELARGVAPAELAGGFALSGAMPLSRSIEESFRGRLEVLPVETRRLLQLAAADPVGEPVLVWQAAKRLGIGTNAATPAADAGLLEIRTRVRFRHPLVRSAAYRSASVQERRDVHRALGEATDPVLDPDRRAWHRAQAAPGPDEDVAEELERSASRAQARGGLAAAAAFLERAATLTPDPARRSGRSLAAAQAEVHAGAPDAALGLLVTAEAGPLDELHRARVGLLRGQIAFASSRGSDAPPLLLAAAKRLERLDARLARETYLDALSAAMFAGRLASPGGTVLEVALQARAAPRSSQPPRSPDLLLDGLALHFTEGYSAGLPALRRAVSAFGRDMSAEEELRWLWLAGVAALHLWDDERWNVLSARYVQLAREAGALGELPLALSSRIYMDLFAGELTVAASMVEEVQAAMEATASNLAPYGALGVAALRGLEAGASTVIEASEQQVLLRGEGIGITVIAWASALLHNGLGCYEKALAAARRASEYPADIGSATWGVVELIEASARSGGPELADAAHRRLSAITRASGTEWALGIEARSGALVSEVEGAERLYRESIERLGHTRVRVDLARSHLLYGEWLRRENRRLDARAQLHTAHDMFASIGAEAFAARGRRELLATGETLSKPTTQGHVELTAQELLIARLARDGLSNPEIGSRLFISPRTVKYHLRKVFSKLDISSRNEIGHVLPSDAASIPRR
jgi:DNA-binding CsgD family transcriptional regulator